MLDQIIHQYGGNISKARKALREASKAFPSALQEVELSPEAKANWKSKGANLWRVLRSRDFFVLVVEQGDVIRLTINRADINGEGIWKDGITWDEIQRLKREAGYGDRLAVEIYPEDEHFVNDANMRHIFILNERPAFAWTSDNRANNP